jgi:serine/threonine protein kinase
MIGKTISHYKIIEKLGQGGMGVVYKAEDIKLKRTVALKFLPHYISANKEDKKRFQIEAQAAAALNHPNIAHIYSIEEINNEMFIVMEFVDGKELKEVIEENDNGTLPLNTIINYATQIAIGLEAAHKIGIVHRDIKTQNIMITKDDEVKIMDFGLAKVKGVNKVTKIGTTVGTTSYMSPEQAKGEEVDHRADIWSYGVVLYEMLTGELPFKGDYVQAIIYSVINDEPELIQKIRDDIPQQIEKIINKTLNKNFQKRYSSLVEVIKELRSISEESAIVKYNSLSHFIFAKKHRLTLYIITFAFLVLIAITGYFSIVTSDVLKQVSIALLPLKNISSESDQDWFTDGMTEALITDLARISGLRVISRSSVMKFKTTDKTSSEIAQALNVSYIIEGSVLKINDQVKITTRLIDAIKDEYLWAQNYNRDYKDILSLQSEVAQSIAEQIKVKITPYEKDLLIVKHKINPEAYEAYLKGMFYYYKLNQIALETALNYFNLAVKLDSTYALSYVGIAKVWGARMQNGYAPPDIADKERNKAVWKALDIDSTLAEVYSMLGGINAWSIWDFKKAESNFLEAIKLDPNFADVRVNYSHILFVLKRPDEARKQIKLALSLDPFNTLFQGFYAMSMMYSHRYDEVINLAEKILLSNPEDPIALSTLKSAYHQKGMYNKAIEIWRASYEINKDYEAINILESAYKKAGYSAALKSLAEFMIKRSKTKFVTPWQISTLYTRAGMKNEAIDWLEKAFEAHDPNMPYINIDPIFDYMRNEQRFKNLINKMGL